MTERIESTVGKGGGRYEVRPQLWARMEACRALNLGVHYGCWEAFGEAVVGQDLFAVSNCQSSCHGYHWGNGL